MVESDWKKERHREEQNEHTLVFNADYQQEEETEQQDHKLRDDDVREDRAHEEAVLAFEEREAVWAVMADAERLGHDLRSATRRAEQAYRPL